MANSTLDRKALSEHDEFRNRIRQNLIDVCEDIVSGESDTVAYAEERKAYARQVISNADNHVHRACQLLSVIEGIYQNMRVVKDPLTPDEVTDGAEVGDLYYSGSKSDSTWFDAMDQAIKEQIENEFNYIAGIAVTVA